MLGAISATSSVYDSWRGGATFKLGAMHQEPSKIE
jgi:hypothetical protein